MLDRKELNGFIIVLGRIWNFICILFIIDYLITGNMAQFSEVVLCFVLTFSYWIIKLDFGEKDGGE